MSRRLYTQASPTANSGDIGDLDRAAVIRRQADWGMSMSERLARVHELSKQMSAIKGAAKSR